MNLRDQLCDPILGERLKELGVPQESMWYWSVPEKRWVYHIDRKPTYVYVSGKRYDVNYVSLFTVAELGEKLPVGLTYYKRNDGWEVFNWHIKEIEISGIKADTEANVRAEMYAYLLEKGIIKL